jgi:hypothetical protein
MAGRMINGAAALAELVRAVGETDEPGVHRVLPVVPELSGLLPARGLRRGSTVAVATGRAAPASGGTSLLLALLSEASRSGSWCAVVGVPSLGAIAAAESGIALDRLALVPNPGPDWPTVVAALIDGVDVVVTAVPGGVSASVATRLVARARQRGSVLVPFGRWDGADVTLQVTHGRWEGLAAGRGRLRRREVTVLARGRGAAARPKEITMWMPGVTVRPSTIPPAPTYPEPTPTTTTPSSTTSGSTASAPATTASTAAASAPATSASIPAALVPVATAPATSASIAAALVPVAPAAATSASIAAAPAHAATAPATRASTSAATVPAAIAPTTTASATAAFAAVSISAAIAPASTAPTSAAPGSPGSGFAAPGPAATVVTSGAAGLAATAPASATTVLAAAAFDLAEEGLELVEEEPAVGGSAFPSGSVSSIASARSFPAQPSSPQAGPAHGGRNVAGRKRHPRSTLPAVV